MNIFVHRPLALCCAFFLFTFFVSAFVSVALTITFILISLVFAVIFFSKKKIISAVCLVIILALTYGHLYYNMYISSQTAYIGQELDMTVEVTDISFSSDRTIYFDASIKEGCSIDIIHLTIEAPHTSVRIGDVLDVTARIIPIENTDEFDNRRYCNSKGIFVEGEVRKYNVLSNAYNYFRSAVTIVQDYCSDSYYKYTDEDTAGLLTALSTGDKSGVDDSVRRDFSRIGTSHMLAISGMHLAVVMGVVSYV